MNLSFVYPTLKRQVTMQLIQLAKLTRTSKDFGPIVIVRVGIGEKQRTFKVYKGLLTHYSAYFLKALKDTWAEGEDKIVQLPGEYRVGFEVFYNWLYTRSIYTPTKTGEIPLTYECIINSYIFGDAHQSPEFCNAAIGALMQKSDQDQSFPLYCLA